MTGLQQGSSNVTAPRNPVYSPVRIGYNRRFGFGVAIAPVCPYLF